MATDAEHQLLGQIVKQLAEPIEGVEAFTVVAYPTAAADATQLVTFLQSVYPGIKISADPGGATVDLGCPSIHAKISQSLAELNADQVPVTIRCLCGRIVCNSAKPQQSSPCCKSLLRGCNSSPATINR